MRRDRDAKGQGKPDADRELTPGAAAERGAARWVGRWNDHE